MKIKEKLIKLIYRILLNINTKPGIKLGQPNYRKYVDCFHHKKQSHISFEEQFYFPVLAVRLLLKLKSKDEWTIGEVKPRYSGSFIDKIEPSHKKITKKESKLLDEKLKIELKEWMAGLSSNK